VSVSPIPRIVTQPSEPRILALGIGRGLAGEISGEVATITGDLVRVKGFQSEQRPGEVFADIGAQFFYVEHHATTLANAGSKLSGISTALSSSGVTSVGARRGRLPQVRLSPPCRRRSSG